ncbi:MAG: SDR family oxidoreductase [Thermoanaerobaculia bacterium]|nr:SDR family oxidoreductase [Thermoanaerobaculia bacterium]
MNIAIFGSTGGTGRELVGQALERGHDVRALARSPLKLSLLMDYVTVIRGDVLTDHDRIEKTVQQTEAVLVALGTDLIRRDDPVESEGTRNIISAMKSQGVKRLIVESAFGVGESRDYMRPPALKMMETILGPILEDKERQESLVRASGLDYVIVRPPTLSKGQLTGVYKIGEKLEPRMISRISRADVAHFMLNQLDHPRNLGRAVTIAY